MDSKIILKPKKWGKYSIGIIIPQEVIKERGIGENSLVELTIKKVKKPSLREIFGTMKKSGEGETEKILKEFDEGLSKF